MINQQNHAAGGANGSIVVGMFVCLCLASKKPSEQEFFVPARKDLGVKLLIARGIHTATVSPWERHKGLQENWAISRKEPIGCSTY